MADSYQQATHSGFNQQSPGALQQRTDTQLMLEKVEAFLKGSRITGYKSYDDGRIEPVFSQTGRPLMNEIGIQNMMNTLSLWFNPHTVQGNFTFDQYQYYIEELAISVRKRVMTNLHDWDVDIKNFTLITDDIILVAQAFFSRLIENKERESYSETMKIIDRQGSDGGKVPLMNR